MAELEIHHHEGGHGHGHDPHDPMGQKVGILVAIFAVGVALVTIKAHRSHTESVMMKSMENDKWAYYQSKKIKLHTCEVGRDVITLVAPKGEATDKKIEEYKQSIERYEKESDSEKEKAQKLGEQVEDIEKRAFKFDLGEGLLEIALVMSSLYFIAKKSLFPIVGTLAGIAGAAMAIYGLIM